MIIIKGGKMQTLQKICLMLTIIGAIVWGLIGIFDFNLVATIFGDNTTLSRIIYDILIAILLLLIAPYIKNILWILTVDRSSFYPRKYYGSFPGNLASFSW